MDFNMNYNLDEKAYEKLEKSKKAKQIGKQISSIRIASKISREKLSEQSNISTNYLYEIETGKKVPNVIIFDNICKALGVSTDKILNADSFDKINEFIYNIAEDFFLLTDKDRNLIENNIHFLANENRKNV